MVLPKTIHEQSPLDPLLLLPLPSKLPPSPLPSLSPLLEQIESNLSHLRNAQSGPSNLEANLSMSVLTAQMRQITRRTHILVNAARVGTATAREELDTVDVDLRGVEYEMNRIKEEIDKCDEYEPAYKEMELPDLQTFKQTVGPETLSNLPPTDDEAYEYALTIARLEHELAEIEKREALVAQLTKERDAIIRAKKEIKNSFNGVETYLTDYAKTTSMLAKKVSDPTKVTLPSTSS